MPTHSARRLSLAPDPPEDPRVLADEAMDTVAAVFRALAQTARDDDTAASLDAWARHLLVLTPAPGLADAPAGTRQWSHARTTASVHIKREATAALRGMSDLQDVVWAVVESTSRIVEEDAKLDRRAGHCLEKLREAAGLPPAELRRAALEAVAELGQVLETRSARENVVDGELSQRIATLTAQLSEARREADLDALTGLATRRVLDRELERATYLRKIAGDEICLLLVDLDNFKTINDLRGHTAGDDALRIVSHELIRTFPRSSDVIARYGGDEFAVLLRYVTRDDGEKLAERFLTALRQHEVGYGEDSLRLTASVGVAEIGVLDTTRSVAERADRALYDAKAAGRDTVVTAPPHAPT
jgi:diguanylate cyclase